MAEPVTLNVLSLNVGLTGTIAAYGIVGVFHGNTYEAAVYGPEAAHFTVHNRATIVSAGTSIFDAGMLLAASGTVLNAATIIGSDGVLLTGTGAGGIVMNGGVIVGTIGAGVQLKGGGSVENTGTVAGALAGISLAAGGYVYNGGHVTGATGVELGAGAADYVYNTGVIDAALHAGISLATGGGANNAGTIAATVGSGIYITGATGIAYNYGLITAGGDAIYLGAGGAAYNENGTLFGAAGIAIVGPLGAIAENRGAIVATAGAGIYLGTEGIATNGGEIFAQGNGIELTEGGTAANTGRITATGDGILLSSGEAATNSGSIIASTGIYTQTTATITNAHTGNIAGTANVGIKLASGGWFSNAGTVTGAYQGVLLQDGGTVTNAGSIFGRDVGVSALGVAAATIINIGTIAAHNNFDIGVYLYVGGTLLNKASGLIEGFANGIVARYVGGDTTIVNAGTIAGPNGTGVKLQSGGTVIDTGTISGGIDAVYFGAAASRLVIDFGAKIIGTVIGGGGVLELAPEAGKTGTIDIAADRFTDFATIQLDKKTIADFTGTFTSASETTFINNGTLTFGAKDLATIDGAIKGSGLIDLAKQPLTLNGAVAADQTIKFSGTGKTLALGDPGAFTAAIAGFARHNTIDLTSLERTAITGAHMSADVLTLDETAGSLTLTFTGAGADTFGLFSDGAGTGITLAAAAPGFLISSSHAAHLPYAMPAPELFSGPKASLRGPVPAWLELGGTPSPWVGLAGFVTF